VEVGYQPELLHSLRKLATTFFRPSLRAEGEAIQGRAAMSD
jgi:hypothetical protein